MTTSKVMVFSDRMDASPLITAVELLMGPITDMYRQQVKARSESTKPQPATVRQYETAVYGFRPASSTRPASNASNDSTNSVLTPLTSPGRRWSRNPYTVVSY